MPSGAAARSRLDDRRRVGRVGDEEDVVVAADVGDEVVDDAAVVLAAHRVLGLTGTDAAQVVGEARVDEVDRADVAGTTADAGLAEVAHVEETDALAHRRVLGDDTATGVLDRHLPPAEVGHLGAEGDVTVMDGRVQQIAHVGTLSRGLRDRHG